MRNHIPCWRIRALIINIPAALSICYRVTASRLAPPFVDVCYATGAANGNLQCAREGRACLPSSQCKGQEKACSMFWHAVCSGLQCTKSCRRCTPPSALFRHCRGIRNGDAYPAHVCWWCALARCHCRVRCWRQRRRCLGGRTTTYRNGDNMTTAGSVLLRLFTWTMLLYGHGARCWVLLHSCCLHRSLGCRSSWHSARL